MDDGFDNAQLYEVMKKYLQRCQTHHVMKCTKYMAIQDNCNYKNALIMKKAFTKYQSIMKESLLEVKKQNEERENKEEEEAWCKYNKVEIVQVKY